MDHGPVLSEDGVRLLVTTGRRGNLEVLVLWVLRPPLLWVLAASYPPSVRSHKVSSVIFFFLCQSSLGSFLSLRKNILVNSGSQELLNRHSQTPLLLPTSTVGSDSSFSHVILLRTNRIQTGMQYNSLELRPFLKEWLH